MGVFVAIPCSTGRSAVLGSGDWLVSPSCCKIADRSSPHRFPGKNTSIGMELGSPSTKSWVGRHPKTHRSVRCSGTRFKSGCLQREAARGVLARYSGKNTRCSDTDRVLLVFSVFAAAPRVCTAVTSQHPPHCLTLQLSNWKRNPEQRACGPWVAGRTSFWCSESQAPTLYMFFQSEVGTTEWQFSAAW